jgi:hypothetical protein
MGESGGVSPPMAREMCALPFSIAANSVRLESAHHTYARVVAGLVPATPRVEALRKAIGVGRDRSGHDAHKSRFDMNETDTKGPQIIDPGPLHFTKSKRDYFEMGNAYAMPAVAV